MVNTSTSGLYGAAAPSDVSSNVANRVSEMDPETRLMVVCYQMLSLLDMRMQGQMDILQAKNQRASQLKEVINSLNDLLAQFDPKDPQATDTIKVSENKSQIDTVNAKLAQAGLPNLVERDGKIQRSDMDAAVQKVTGMMDSNTTVQQLDMFTLQSVFSKRNENFELMSNSLKKSQDTKSSLIRNF